MKNLLQQVMVKKEIHNGDTDFTKGLIESIEKGYTVGLKPKYAKKYSFSPSTIVWNHGECARFWYLAFEGTVWEDNADAYGVANRTGGNLSHGRIQDALLKSGVLAEDLEMDPEPRKYNQQIHPAMELAVKSEDPPINGFADAMLHYNGTDIVGEIKTVPNEGFEYRKMHRKPKMDHLKQVLIYMKVFKKDKGVLIYENKNNHELLTLPIELNDHYRRWVNQAFDWMRTVRKAWVDQTIPKRNYRSNSKICARCPIQKACSEAEAGTIKIDSLENLGEEL
jgi:CRISPR/Cas system-associated exonuclease Cas4 (RecB family)